MKSFLRKAWGWLKPRLKAIAFMTAETLLADALDALRAARAAH